MQTHWTVNNINSHTKSEAAVMLKTICINVVITKQQDEKMLVMWSEHGSW